MAASVTAAGPVRRPGDAVRPGTAAPPAPPAPASGDHLLFGLLFGSGLATGLELWWLGTPVSTITTIGDGLTAAGRVTGMIAGYALLAQLVLTSRLGWLERGVGTHTLLRWHRWVGTVLVVAVSAHVATTLVGYAAATGAPVTGQAWLMLTTYEDMLGASVAAGLVLVVAVSSVRFLRRTVPYEVWRSLHLTAYVAVWLGYGHQFALGQELAGGFGRWYWVGLHVLVAGCAGWGRLVGPVARNLRHRLRVLDVLPEAPGVVSIYVRGRRLERLAAAGGQFFRWRFLARGCWWQAHPFSLSAAPDRRWLRLTVKAVGRHTARLQRLAPGTPVFVHGPSGVFTAARRRRARALLIAAGSGIAPVRALLADLPPAAVVIYRARGEADLVFRAELERIARQRNARIWYVLGHRDDPGPRRLLTPAGLRGLVPDVRRRDVYLCGPAGLVTAVRATLRRLRVPRRQIHLDPFEL